MSKRSIILAVVALVFFCFTIFSVINDCKPKAQPEEEPEEEEEEQETASQQTDSEQEQTREQPRTTVHEEAKAGDSEMTVSYGDTTAK